jgi:GH43 family beta-xylosidase
VQHEGFYYWCATDADQGVVVCRSRSLTSLGERFVVWKAPDRGPYSAQVWAPELHRFDGRWYIYVAVSNGENATHRMIVLESAADDPTGRYDFRSELYTGDDYANRGCSRWAIDGTVLSHRGQRYFLWSGWRDESDEQWLYIAPMSTPWTISGARVRLCGNNDHLWERVGESRRGRGLNEAPQILQRDGRVFLVYSCSGSWEPTYKLGMLELARDGDPMDPGAWHKRSSSVFEPTADTFGVGHCCFTKSPDGTEDWIVYHAKVSRQHGWKRVIHAQRFSWDSEGRPVFGNPVGSTLVQRRPGGEVEAEALDALHATRRLVQRVQIVNVAGESNSERLTAN